MKITAIKKSLQKQLDILDSISEKLADIIDECQDQQLCNKIDNICQTIDNMINGDDPKASFPDVFDYIDEELLNQDY